jgi:hypothetical protein
MDWLVLIAGGSYKERPEWTKSGNKTKIGSKPCYSWSVTSERAAILVRAIQPHLIVKRAKAHQCLAAWTESRDFMQRPARRDHHTLKTRAEMAALGWSVS